LVLSVIIDNHDHANIGSIFRDWTVNTQALICITREVHTAQQPTKGSRSWRGGGDQTQLVVGGGGRGACTGEHIQPNQKTTRAIATGNRLSQERVPRLVTVIVCAWVECEGFIDVWDAEAMVELDPRNGVHVCMVVRRMENGTGSGGTVVSEG
jgi:hypothetical protein